MVLPLALQFQASHRTVPVPHFSREITGIIRVVLVLYRYPCPNYFDTHTHFGFQVVFGLSPEDLLNWTPEPNMDIDTRTRVHVACLELCGKPCTSIRDIIYQTKILVIKVFAHVYLNIFKHSIQRQLGNIIYQCSNARKHLLYTV